MLETRMRFPTHLLKTSTFRAEPWLAAMAAVAVGMFVGTLVLGPAITHDRTEAPAAQERAKDRTSYEDMINRPDPMPYRAATPAFDLSGPPNYGAVAKEKAQGQVGGEMADGELPMFQRSDSHTYRSGRYRATERHTTY
jgi:hypothetical protein